MLDREEQARLIMAVRLAQDPVAFDLFTGLRLGELCGLRWENVSMEHQVFQVCETRNRLPNYDDAIAAARVRTVATTETENSRWTVSCWTIYSTTWRAIRPSRTPSSGSTLATTQTQIFML